MATRTILIITWYVRCLCYCILLSPAILCTFFIRNFLYIFCLQFSVHLSLHPCVLCVPPPFRLRDLITLSLLSKECKLCNFSLKILFSAFLFVHLYHVQLFLSTPCSQTPRFLGWETTFHTPMYKISGQVIVLCIWNFFRSSCATREFCELRVQTEWKFVWATVYCRI
jgi:hypothetical protein